ncbi:STAS domain-containing protein [Tsukamurella sp. 8F]|uniref:STAS domain-containing protein n=1 Tax=unclassified Tsukamurella TaxID=2633480 RepID=UPI0023B92DBF|nr:MULTISPECIES: STAS domain-containing protein [unclassified Tsukamurella]MDF0532104.1 STAS domain-containing protein [Tsukamurella sp. 8J]MDF0589218.1 STAS domain-containing protein [Tsukamurella sp. 8F]
MVAVRGCLDAAELPFFRSTLAAALAGAQRVRIDLRGVDFLSIGAAAHLGAVARDDGSRRVDLVGISDPAAHTLEATGLGHLLTS